LESNYIEDNFKKISLFKDEKVFEPDFIPKKLLHRENELILLSRMFFPLIKNPNSISKKILITGNVGVGKSVTIYFFGKMLEESAQKRNLKIYFVHINCRINYSSYLVLKNIVDKLKINIPIRGVSPIELLEIIIEFLIKNNAHLILVLDEMNYFQKKDFNFIYTLIRINETKKYQIYFLSIIGIVKELNLLKNFDESIKSPLQNEIIHFRNYNIFEIFDIIKDRVNLGLKEDIISDDLLKRICELSIDSGDIRKSLKILKNAVLYSEYHGFKTVTMDSIRISNAEYISLDKDQLSLLNFHELLLLKSICNLIQNTKRNNLTINEIKEEYFNLCLEKREKPRSNTQIWEYIQKLRTYDFIQSEIINKDIKGRKCLIRITNYPIDEFKRQLEVLINEK